MQPPRMGWSGVAEYLGYGPDKLQHRRCAFQAGRTLKLAQPSKKGGALWRRRSPRRGECKQVLGGVLGGDDTTLSSESGDEVREKNLTMGAGKDLKNALHYIKISRRKTTGSGIALGRVLNIVASAIKGAKLFVTALLARYLVGDDSCTSELSSRFPAIFSRSPCARACGKKEEATLRASNAAERRAVTVDMAALIEVEGSSCVSQTRVRARQ
ncbi:hypothetical protein FGB62_238g08 [Gracilaria domingensis]|nr:hypothetical protein FGB62_238g08 [Gracilaria domingensis]